VIETPAGSRRARAVKARAGEKHAPQAVALGTPPALPPEWRTFLGRWLEAAGCTVKAAARGDWEVELSPALQRRWRRQRVRLVFDPLRATLPRGAWFAAPGSSAGRKILEAALEPALYTRRTALARVPGAPEDGLASVCRVRGLSWGPARLGPVRYERRVAFHAVVTRWGGLPWQEPWVLLLGAGGEFLEWASGTELPELRTREGLYQISDELTGEQRDTWVAAARRHLERLLGGREQEWERAVSRLRDDEQERLGAFFSSRIEEEEERLRRRSANGDEAEIEQGDATSLKLEWERRAAEVRQRWALRTQVRLWGLEEWSWPVADLEQELRAGAVRVRLTSAVDVARGKPLLPRCPSCGAEAEMLVRSRGAVTCARCA
jgi:hypothetical protein